MGSLLLTINRMANRLLFGFKRGYYKEMDGICQ